MSQLWIAQTIHNNDKLETEHFELSDMKIVDIEDWHGICKTLLKTTYIAGINRSVVIIQHFHDTYIVKDFVKRWYYFLS